MEIFIVILHSEKKKPNITSNTGKLVINESIFKGIDI